MSITSKRALRRAGCGLALGLLFQAGGASAMSLLQAYDAALNNDPAYRMNYYENEAGKENRILGRSNLLPSVAASYGANRNRVDLTQQIAGNESVSHPQYISRSAVVQVRQPLFSTEAVARYKQGVAQANQSAAHFEANRAEVALRLVGAYVDVLYAIDQLNQITAQRAAMEEQKTVNERLFAKGEGTRTDMLETQARLDLADAQVLEAQDNLTANRNTLEGILGSPPGTLEPLAANFSVRPQDQKTFEQWRVIALDNNPDLKAARFAIDAAEQDVKRANAGHTPRLDLVASYSKADSETINTYNQSSVNRSIGVQLNIPLYAGGSVSAAARQAVAGVFRAKADFDGRSSRVLVELRKAHALLISSVSRIEALEKAVNSSKLLVTATAQSIKGGVRINLDLLTAQQQQATSERDLAQARYSYVLALLRLRAAAGVFRFDDMRDVATYFHF